MTRPLHIRRQSLDRLMPMNLQIDDRGIIRHVGPTLAKTRSVEHFIGHSVFDLFEFKRPRDAVTVDELRANPDAPLRLSFRDPPHTALRGTLAETWPGHGLLMNLSFGLSILDSIRAYKLHSGDFATTDPTIEMLYLIEAKSAAMDESRDLNRRLQVAKIAAEEQAFTDTLTGLKNRRAMDHILSRYAEHQIRFTLLGIDLDYFKSVNDNLGHAAGDHVLQRVARIMLDLARPGDTLVRCGGDEFLMMLCDRVDTGEAVEFGRTLIRRIEEPIPFQSDICRISASIGITSTALYDEWTVEQMLHDVDAALYVSKRAGRAQATVFSEGLVVTGEVPRSSGDRLNARVPADLAKRPLGRTA